jgi:ATP-dependent Clp protease ATP-binding subunit ClpC
MVLAQEEASALGHDFIGTEHLLLGLIREGDGVAAKALEQLGISVGAARTKVGESLGASAAMAEGGRPFTPRAKKVLELSLREALQLGHNYIGTEHVLLGLIREGEGVGSRVLIELGADLSRVREKVMELLSSFGALREPLAAPLGEAHGTATCPSCRRPLSDLAHRSLVSTALGSHDDTAEAIQLTVVYCPSCGAVMGILSSGPQQGLS